MRKNRYSYALLAIFLVALLALVQPPAAQHQSRAVREAQATPTASVVAPMAPMPTCRFGTVTPSPVRPTATATATSTGTSTATTAPSYTLAPSVTSSVTNTPTPKTPTRRPTPTRIIVTVPAGARIERVTAYVPMAGGINGGACIGRSWVFCFVQVGDAACAYRYKLGQRLQIHGAVNRVDGVPLTVTCRDRGGPAVGVDIALVGPDVEADLWRARQWGAPYLAVLVLP